MAFILAMAVIAAVTTLAFRYCLSLEKPQDVDPPEGFSIALTGGPNPVFISEQARFQHVELVGSTGTGKNYYGLLPMIHQDLQSGAGLVIVDPKGAMRPAVEAYAEAFHRSKDLRCLDLSDPDFSDTYNPFVGDDPALVAERVHAALFADDGTSTPYYRDLALALLYPFFGLCHRLGVLPTPAQLRGICGDQQALAAFIALAPRAVESRDLRRRVLRQGPLDFSKNYQGLVNALAPLSVGAFAPLLNTCAPGVVLADVLERGGIVYAGLASDQYPGAFRKVATLLLMDLQASLTKRYAARAPPCFVYLDEFADVFYPQARALIAKAREARVGLVVAHQGLGDLERHGAAVAESVFGNTSNKILFRQGSADSALALARLSGTRASAQRLHEAPRRRGLKGRRQGRGLSVDRGQDYLFDPNELLNLSVGEAFMIVQNPRGRKLFRGPLLRAPKYPSVAPKNLASPAGKAWPPLVLADVDEPVGEPREPGSSLGAAAVERLDRRRRRT